MQKASKTFFNLDDIVPELREILSQPPLKPDRLALVAIAVQNPDDHGGKLVPAESDRNLIALTDGDEFWHWEANSLRELFRGDRKPPVLGDYPEAYDDSFALFDLHVLELSRFLGDRRDSEMKEIYSMLRRRPDGRSLGFAHDYLWQAAALVLATRPLSQAEFEAIMARLERSCRTFEENPTSRNYVAALRKTYGRAGAT